MAEHDVDGEWELRVVAGPDAGRTIPLNRSTNVIGGPACRGGSCIDDAALAPYHLLLDVSGDQVVLRPLADPHLRAGRFAAGEPMALGGSVMWAARPDRRRARLVDAVTPRPHHRPPRVHGPDDPEPPAAPAALAETPDPGVTSPVPTLLGAAITMVISVAIRQPMLAILGLSGSAVALATWGYGMHVRRRHRRERQSATHERARHRADQLREHHDAMSVHRRLVTDDLCSAVTRAHTHDTRIWQRRPHHDDVWRVVLGLGEDVIEVVDERGVATEVWRSPLRDVPVTVDLAPGTLIGVSGVPEAGRGLVRSLVVQLASSVGPADLQFVVEVDRRDGLDEWQWLHALPHQTEVQTFADRSLPPSDRHRIRILDTARPVTVAQSADAVVVIVPEPTDLPSSATAYGTLDVRGSLRWFTSHSGGLPTPITAALCPWERATGVAAALSELSDPEDTSGSVFRAVRLGELVSVDHDAVLERWQHGGDDPQPRTTLGRLRDGSTLDLDLARDGPHAVIGGTTGSGKSEMLRSLVVGLAAHSPPWALSFVLVDFKGGAAFDACLDLPHVVGVLTDLDAHSTERALRSLDAELQRREQLLREAAVSDLTSYRRTRASPDIARLVIVVDEFASLAVEMPATLRALVGVAQRGRSLGVHLVLATQRPAGVITEDISANTAIRIALRVATPGESLDIVDDTAAALFPRDRPGRAMIRLGSDEPLVAQIASCGDAGHVGEDPLADAVAAIRRAHVHSGGVLPHRPWLAPLPTHLGPAQLEHPFDHGAIDDPAAQSRRPLRWHPGDGHLVVVGVVGSGCTSTLQTVVRQTVAAYAEVEVHIVDGIGERSWDAFLDVAAVGSVIRLDETERLLRLLTHLARVVNERRGATDDVSPMVLVVDGVSGLRRVVDDDGIETAALLGLVMDAGPATGVVIVAASDHAGAVPMALTARATKRWIHALADPLDASLLGASPRAVPDVTSPPGRLLAVPDMLEAQVLHPGGHAPPHRNLRTAQSIELLAQVVDGSTLPSSRVERTGVMLTVGVGARDLQPVRVLVERGEHLVVVGPARSGRTSVLLMIAEEWQAATDQTVVALCTRVESIWQHVGKVVSCTTVSQAVDAVAAACASMSECEGNAAVLLVVDDADRIEDELGQLERLALADDVTIAAAVRHERLRGVFGHWTSAIRRSRTGIVLGGVAHGDGADLIGAILPRRSPVPPAPGRGWWIDDGTVRDVVQTRVPRGGQTSY